MQYQKNDDNETLASKITKVTYDIVELFYEHRVMLQDENCDVTLFQLLYQIHAYSRLIVNNSHSVIWNMQRNKNRENIPAFLKEIKTLIEKLSLIAQDIQI